MHAPLRAANEMGIYRFDIETLSEELLISFPWDNGWYYAEDMWMNGTSVVVSFSNDWSLSRSEAEPLTAITFHPDTGVVNTVEMVGFVRPAWIT